MVGTFASAHVVISGVIVCWAVVIVAKRQTWPPMIGLLVSGAICITAIGSIAPLVSLSLGLIVLALFIVSKHVRAEWNTRDFLIGLMVGASPQVITGVMTWGAERPGLLSLNASQLAQTGLVFWLITADLSRRDQWMAWIPATIQMSIGMARAPMIAVIAYLLFKSSKRLFLMTIIFAGVFAITGILQGNLDRLLPNDIIRAAGVRLSLLEVVEPPFFIGGTELVMPDSASDVHVGAVTRTGSISGIEALKEAAFQWTGYGFGNYVNVTGILRPHNAFILLFYEMGILAVIPIIFLGWAVYYRKLPIAVFLSLFLLWQVTEEATGRIEGFFTTCAVLTAVWRAQPPKATLLSAIQQRLRLAK